MDTFTIVISSPTHSPHKFTLTLSRQCSILELKEIIASRLEVKPSIADQRLIFGGRILEDKDTLENVFEKVDCSDNSPTIHLVVSPRHAPMHQQPKSAPASPAPLRFRTNTTSTASSTITSTPSATTSAPCEHAMTSGTNFSTPHTFHWSSTDGHSNSNNNGMPLPSQYSLPPLTASMTPTWQAPMQYALVNGMPYLIPAAYLPMLHLQQMQMQMYAPLLLMNPDGTPSLQHIPVFTAQQAQMAAAPGTGPGSPERNAQEIAARDQRRAASLWLLMKLAFGVYLFSQNGSIERIVLLHIAALIIFLHQTGRLRIVRRIVQPPADAPPGVGVPQPGNQEQTPNPAQQPPQAATTAASDSASGSSGGAVSGTSKPTTAGSGSISNQASAASEASASSTTAESSQAQLEGSAGTQQHQQQQQPRVSTWRSIEHALLTFVTSLVPAPPPDIDPAVANAAAAGERGM